MRTYVYVDGFNLYYGSIRKTPYKWLDLKELFSKLLGPSYNILKIKYYTAIISARPEDPNSPIRQMAYLNALQAHIPEIEIWKGHFLAKEVCMKLAKPTPTVSYVNVIRTDEKGSDVNLALHLLNDAWRDMYDCAVVVSNDSDLSEAMRLVKKFHKKKIILLTPGDPSKRPPAIQLKKFADIKKSIPIEVIAASQLPNLIPGTKIHKPKAW